jgi:phage shock protein PspC (stress-responsive transcriptional regulator)
MKKTLTINLGGIVFHIDEDAYQRLGLYLDSLKKHFSVVDDYREILDDIESRIAEIFQENLAGTRQVVTLEDVEKVIRIMGHPSEIEDQGETAGDQQEVNGTRGSKRFYRDPDGKILGGVCSGIGAYFHLDPVWVRIVFLLFLMAGGTSILVYLILWIVMPEAETATDRLEMRGEKITIANIEKSVGEEWKDLKERFGKMADGKQATLKKTKAAGRTVFEFIMDGLLTVIKWIFRAIVITLGFAMVLAGIALIVVLLFYTFGWSGHFFSSDDVPLFALPGMAAMVLKGDVALFFVQVALLLVIGVPLAMLVYSGARMMFRFPGVRYLGLTALNLWIVGLIMTAFLTVRIVNLFKYHADSRQPVRVEKPASDTLFLAFSNHPAARYIGSQVYSMVDDERVVCPPGDELYLIPSVWLRKSDDTVFSISKYLFATGRSQDEAESRINRMDYSAIASGDTLFLDPFVRIPGGDPWRGQKVTLTVNVPQGKFIHFDRKLGRFFGFGLYMPASQEEHTYRMTGTWLQEPEDATDSVAR